MEICHYEVKIYLVINTCLDSILLYIIYMKSIKRNKHGKHYTLKRKRKSWKKTRTKRIFRRNRRSKRVLAGEGTPTATATAMNGFSKSL